MRKRSRASVNGCCSGVNGPKFMDCIGCEWNYGALQFDVDVLLLFRPEVVKHACETDV